ncbi:MAG: iron chaperone [Methanobacteriaceae archaeon]
MKNEFKNFDDYIIEYPKEIQERLEEIRQVIKSVVPEAEERISYNMLSFRFHGNLVYYGAFKNHIGFYPASMTVFEKFKYELKNYKQSGNGTVQFPYKKPLPLKLIKQIIQFRASENLEKN